MIDTNTSCAHLAALQSSRSSTHIGWQADYQHGLALATNQKNKMVDGGREDEAIHIRKTQPTLTIMGQIASQSHTLCQNS
jgi:hypothetical protein